MTQVEEEKKRLELMDLFKVKTNPVVDFWFIPKWVISDKLNTPPEGFTLYQEKKLESDKTLWCCYCKKAVNGCFDKSYWSTEV